jgi:REP element-mobilizing transposase RayT
MTYNPDLDHRRSHRLQTWEYRDTGAYFVTVCTHDRSPLFGRFAGEQLALSKFGDIVTNEWWRSAELREGIDLDSFMVMPNHVHGIIWIRREPTVGARRASPLRSDPGNASRRQPQGAASGSLGAIVGSFKSAAAKRINQLRNTPGAPVWQRNYHDRIIRSERELNAARQYILDNPRKWAEDKHNPAVFRKHT